MEIVRTVTLVQLKNGKWAFSVQGEGNEKVNNEIGYRLVEAAADIAKKATERPAPIDQGSAL